MEKYIFTGQKMDSVIDLFNFEVYFLTGSDFVSVVLDMDLLEKFLRNFVDWNSIEDIDLFVVVDLMCEVIVEPSITIIFLNFIVFQMKYY